VRGTSFSGSGKRSGETFTGPIVAADHFFSGVPCHQHLGKTFDASRLGGEVREDVPEEKRV